MASLLLWSICSLLLLSSASAEVGPSALTESAWDALPFAADHHPDCSPEEPALLDHYRAALAHLVSLHVRRAVLLQDSCPSSLLLRAVRQAQLEVETWSPGAALDLQADGAEVAFLAATPRLLLTALRQTAPQRRREAVWYAPGLVGRPGESVSELGEEAVAPGLRVITTEVSEEVLRDADHVSSSASGDAATSFQHNTSQLAEVAARGSRSVAVLRWAPPRPLAQSRLVHILRASSWLLVGTQRGGEPLQVSPALFLMRHRLQSRLAAGEGSCAAWRLDLSAADPVTSATVRRQLSLAAMPVAVASQAAVMQLRARCQGGAASELHCIIRLDTESCRWAPPAGGRHRRSASARWSHPQQRRASQWWQSAPRHETSPSYRHQSAVYRHTPAERRQVYPQQPTPTYRQRTYPVQTPVQRSGALARADRRRTGRRGGLTKRQETLIGPFASCGGAMGGCGICILLLDSHPITTPLACVGSCGLGIMGNCVRAIAELKKELYKEEEKLARRFGFEF